MREKIGLKDKNGTEIRVGDIIRGNFNGWIQKGVVFYDPPCYKLKWDHISRRELVDNYTEIIEFTHPKFHYQNDREIIGNEIDNPEQLEGYIQD